MPLIEGCKHYLEITVPVADVAAETKRVIESIAQKARMPGFRPGKVPQSLVKTRFAAEIRQDVVEAIIPKAFQKQAEADHLKVVSTPNVSEIKFEEGEPLWFKAEFEVAPEFDLNQYKGLSVVYKEPELTDADILARIDTIREQKAEYVNIDPRPSAHGDFALVKLESLSGATPPVNEDEVQLELGHADTFPPFTENITGMTPDEEKEFEVVYPEDYGTERLAGKTVKFRATLKMLRRKELPELNDEFAQDLGDFKTAEELKEAVRKTIFSEREATAQGDAKAKLIDALVLSHEFPVPEAYVERQVQNIVDGRIRQFAEQGIDPAMLKNLDWDKVREQHKEQAGKDVRASLILDKIATTEAINATNEEIDREVQRIARQEREVPAATRRRLEKDGMLGKIANHFRTEKTLGLLFESAVKTSE